MHHPVKLCSRRLAAAALAAAAAVLVLWRLFGPPGPEQVRHRALSALVRRDAPSLVALADPDELARLGLTQDNVGALLRQTIWKAVPPLAIRSTEPVTRLPRDQRIWRVRFEERSADSVGFLLEALDDPKTGWRLNLSFLLGSACRELGPRTAARRYLELARRFEIRGARIQDGSYLTIAQMEQRLVRR